MSQPSVKIATYFYIKKLKSLTEKLKIKQKPKFFLQKILPFAKKVVPLYQN